jgi:hypothetical protein
MLGVVRCLIALIGAGVVFFFTEMPAKACFPPFPC